MSIEYLDRDDAFDAHAEAVEISVTQAQLALLNENQQLPQVADEILDATGHLAHLLDVFAKVRRGRLSEAACGMTI